MQAQSSTLWQHNLQVSTKVGGVPEVMPDSMIKYARPDVKDLVETLSVSTACIRAHVRSETVRISCKDLADASLPSDLYAIILYIYIYIYIYQESIETCCRRRA